MPDNHSTAIVQRLWSPRYTITPAIARGLMGIEAARAVVERTPLPLLAEPEAVQHLDNRVRRVLALFATTDRITAGQVAETLGLSPRMARNLLQAWVDDGWLVVVDPSKRKRAYGLSAIYRQYIGSLTAMKPE